MITKINNKDYKIAQQIYDIFQASYTVEAELLKVVDFPPLSRTILELSSSDSKFYGYFYDKKIVGVAEIKTSNEITHIQSLVVCPKYFRRGIGSKMVQFVLDTYNSNIFTVETGVDNYPAITLYKRFAFEEEFQWDTDHAVRKIRLQRIS